MEELMGVAEGLETKKEHILIGKAIHGFESFALNFSTRAIPDSVTRLKYMQATYDYSKELLDAYDQGKLTAKQAAELANQMRNFIMDITRENPVKLLKPMPLRKNPPGLYYLDFKEYTASKFMAKFLTTFQRVQKVLCGKKLWLNQILPMHMKACLLRVLVEPVGAFFLLQIQYRLIISLRQRIK